MLRGFGELEPDAIVEDNVCAFPAIAASGRPWVRIVSCNPLELKDPALPPAFSGLPTDDNAEWSQFRTEYARQVGDMRAGFSEFCTERGAPPLPALEMIDESSWLNLLLYPRELDYPRSQPLGRSWHNLEACVRTTDEPWAPPAELDGAKRLVYLSLGSLGSADVVLMRHLIEVLARSPYRFVFSMGPQHAELELAGNMVGAEFLPQASLLPQVDAVITHGGNNTTTEAMWFGKPMLVLPIFWDQHDNTPSGCTRQASGCACRGTRSRTVSCWRPSTRCWPTTGRGPAVRPPASGCGAGPVRWSRRS